ncbi:MAG TPA: hypothetical protein VJS64_09025 [Pyrinomonadaceae bacterium]|nr:hypothetical protein [Pyrinomonadaceae bacterium]
MTSPCSRFSFCNAPLCPLGDWTSQRHAKGEPVCFYLREVAKHGGSLPLMGDVPSKLSEKVAEAYREIVSSSCSPWGDVRRRLTRAALSPSKCNVGVSQKLRVSP